MINRIKALLNTPGGTSRDAGSRHRFAELQVAAAALLVEAAEMDASFDQQEKAKILDLMRTRFELSETESESLVERARQEAADSSQLYGFTRVVKDQFSHEERVELVEMLWQVVYADGQKHDHEASLMRRVAGLIFVSDRECGSARKRALIKLGLEHE